MTDEFLNKTMHVNALLGLKKLPDAAVNCCVTSPPYFGLRNYGTDPVPWPAVDYKLFGFTISIPELICSLGLEKTPEQFIGHIVLIFREVHRVLRDDGTCWINIGDSYAGAGGSSGHTPETKNLGAKTSDYGAVKSGGKKYGLKSKDLIGIPWMLAFALRSEGWYLRQDIIWSKPNPMPESITDRCTKSHEYIFLLSKSPKYYYDIDAIRTPVKDSTVQKMMQQIEDQKGSERVPGKTNGTMKAVGPGRKPAPQDNRGGNQGSTTGIKAYSHTGHSGNFDSDGNLIGDGMANKKSVWTVTTKPFSEAHFATFPQDLIVDCIKAGCPEGGIVLDPFHGAGTTGMVSRKLNRNFYAFDLQMKYIKLTERRHHKELGLFK